MGKPSAKFRIVFLYVTRFHRDTGIPIEPACKLVINRPKLKVDSAIFDDVRSASLTMIRLNFFDNSTRWLIMQLD